MRKWGISVMAAGVLFSGGLWGADQAAAGASPVQVKASVSSLVVLKRNGVVTEQQGIFRDGKVWVPVSFMRDTLRMPVSFNKAENTYTIGTGNKETRLMVSEYGVAIFVNNYYISEYEGKMLSNKLYVPFDLLSDYLGYQGDWSASTGRLNVLNRAQNPITISTESYEKEMTGVTMKLEYPQVSGLANADAQKAINNTLKQTITSYAAGAEQEIANRTEEDRPYEFVGNYIVTYNQNGVLSLITSQYGYTGGAHGMTYRNAFTFSLKDGKRLLLGDLFGKNPDYKKMLNARLNKELKAEGGYLGGFTGLATEKYFYLKDGKAVLFFQLYEYTAYAQGFPEYTFTFKELLPDGSSPFTSLK
ncbi:PdaC/SigV domain-containing protein [Paenibacillus sp. sgz500958]|uniref:PdaC/SigV domain-containing protein n=1 Tax=Paenibacillus sp. sgz500958 TaxID=3242475 RepID=UPI0036D3C9A8